MENTDQILDNEYFSNDDNKGDPIPYINLEKFILLSVITFGLYEIWWMYKAWKLYKEREDSYIMPAARAFFAIFFMYQLFEWIKGLAHRSGFVGNYNSGLLLAGFFVFNMLSRLPDPFWIISLFSFVFFIQPLKAFNYMLENSPDYNGKLQVGFNGRQIALLVIGGLFWALVLLGLFMPGNEYDGY